MLIERLKKMLGGSRLPRETKKMVAIEDTVEVEYASGKSYRVLSKYIRN